MEFKQAVGNRRSIRYYQPWRPVAPAQVQKVLEAARLQSQHGNVQLIRKAVVVVRDETPKDVWNGLVDALYNQPAAAQAPVHIYWTIDMSGWDSIRDDLLELIKVGALTSSYGWSEQFIDDVVMKTPDFNVMAGDLQFAEWLSAIEMGLAIGSALLAAVDEGLGTGLLTGNREQIRQLLSMPEHATPAQIQLLGYPAEDANAGGQRPRPDFESLYFKGTWGESFPRDPAVVDELTAAGELQPTAPAAWRKAEIRALSGLFGLPE